MPKRERRFYLTQDVTNLTDAQWSASAPFVTAASPQGGRPTDIDQRATVNALRSKQRTGCRWRRLPADVPPMSSVRSSCDTWSRDGTRIKIHDTLHQPARQALDRDPEPSISVLDSQSTKTTEAGGDRGFDGGKKVNGRKRQCWVDTNGFLCACSCIQQTSRMTKGRNGFRMREIRVDEGYKQGLGAWMEKNTAIRLNVIKNRLDKRDVPSFRSDG